VTLRHDDEAAVLSEVDVKGERGGDAQPRHQREGGAVGEGERLVAVPLKEEPRLRHVGFGDLEDRGGGGIEQAFPRGDRARMPEPRLHQS